jgi:hypothetical protein
MTWLTKDGTCVAGAKAGADMNSYGVTTSLHTYATEASCFGDRLDKKKLGVRQGDFLGRLGSLTPIGIALNCLFFYYTREYIYTYDLSSTKFPITHPPSARRPFKVLQGNTAPHAVSSIH